MAKRALLKALLAGGLTTLAAAALTVHAAGAPQAPLTAIDVLHVSPLGRHALSIASLHPGQRVIVVNDMHHPLQIKGSVRRG